MMKKLFCLLLTLCTLFCFSACQKEEDPQNTEIPYKGDLGTYIIGTSNGVSGLTENYEYPWSGGTFQNENALPTMTVTILGVTYTGTYSHSLIVKLNSYITDYYDCTDGTRFGVKSGTNTPVNLNLMTTEYFDTVPFLEDVQNPEDHAVAYAKDIAEQYVDIAAYTLIPIDSSLYECEKNGVTYDMTFYYVTYARIVNGIETSDYVAMKIDSTGHLAAWNLGDLGAFEGYDPATLSIEETNASISSALGQVARSGSNSYESHEVSNQKLTKLPSGEIVVYSTITVTCRDVENEQFKQGVAIITKHE
ncbi:MAG: hypothetical protein IJY50_07605 [Clostridia bacterium]|nr:hypothetical protein [Clostridia bacterium]